MFQQQRNFKTKNMKKVITSILSLLTFFVIIYSLMLFINFKAKDYMKIDTLTVHANVLTSIIK